VATVTVTDGDNDQIVNSTDAVAPLSLTISDTNPVWVSPNAVKPVTCNPKPKSPPCTETA